MRASRYRRGRLAPLCGAGMKKGCRAGWFRRGTRKVAVTYSPAFAVPSARRGLTSLFGMGRGGTPVLWPPECLCAHAPGRGRAYGVKRSGRKQEPDGLDTRGETRRLKATVLSFLGDCAPERFGLLVPLGCARCRACTCGLSTSSSVTALYCGDLISRGASCLDAFSTYPGRGRLPGGAAGATTGTPVPRPTRSSRTSVGASQISYAHNR